MLGFELHETRNPETCLCTQAHAYLETHYTHTCTRNVTQCCACPHCMMDSISVTFVRHLTLQLIRLMSQPQGSSTHLLISQQHLHQHEPMLLKDQTAKDC